MKLELLELLHVSGDKVSVLYHLNNAPIDGTAAEDHARFEGSPKRIRTLKPEIVERSR